MAEKKHISFTMLQILQEESDADHILSANDLISKIQQRLNITIDRRTVYSNIQILRQAGYEISDVSDNGKGYYLMQRKFEKGEILLLCNAIHASHIINQKQSTDLIKKLLSELSREQQKEFTSSVYLPNRLKSENKVLFFNIEIISEAIRDGKMLQFAYKRYDPEKKKEDWRKEPYLIEPRYIVWQDSRPYLIASSPKYSNFIHFRIDRMKNPKVIADPVRRFSRSEHQEAYRYAENKLFMFAGPTMSVVFRAHNRILPQLQDILGPQMNVSPSDGETSILRCTTTEKGAVFLAQQFLDAIEIIAPESLRKTFRNTLQEALQKYQ
ncbi:MAG: transcriptional regulator [Solobacterium sp.]|nr:transcriptional regulator [Solobacterium sp.]